MISRRIALRYLCSTLALAVSAPVIRYATASSKASIVAVLHKCLGYLKLDEAGVQRFADDLIERDLISAERLHIIGAAGPLYSHLSMTTHNMVYDGIRHGEERIITNYLLSTDFFSAGQDETRLIRYLGFYDPVLACGNPFASSVTEPASGRHYGVTLNGGWDTALADTIQRNIPLPECRHT
jgi:hypothetical protein